MTLMQTLRTHFLMTIICSIVALQIFNISVDPADSDLGPEDLTVNDIESCVELVLEVMLDKTDAIGEVDDQDEDSSRPTNAITLFSIEKFWAIANNEFKITRSQTFQYTELSVPTFCPSILCPPPKSIRVSLA